MSDTDKAIVRSFFEKLWNSDNSDAVDDVMGADCDGEICYPRPGDSLPSAVEAFSAANTSLYADSILARLKEMARNHPDLAKSVRKNLIIRHEGNLRGIIKSAARKYREAIPDVQCTIEEMNAQEDLIWTRWTLRGTFQAHGATSGAFLDGKPVTAIAATICRIAEGKIREYRSWIMFPDHWLDAVRGIIPRP